MKKLWMLGVFLWAQAGFGKVFPDEAETLFPAGREGAVIIALDGGTRGQFAEIVPVVERHGMTALVNVDVAKIGVDPAYMAWDDVRALLARGHVLGAMVEHNPLVEKGMKPSLAELEAARERIRVETGITPIATFYGWPGCSNDIRLELERRGVEHQVWRGPNLTRQPEERLKQGCADSIARAHHQILPVSAMSDKDRTAWLPAFARALDALKAAPEIWTPTLLEARARQAAYRRYVERTKKERQLAERYVATAVRAEVVNEGGWDRLRPPGEKVTFRLGFAAPDETTAPLVKGLKATVTIDNFGTRRQFCREVVFGPETMLTCEGVLNEPGFLRLMVEVPDFGPNQGRPWQRAVAFAPERIVQVQKCPADFDDFWAKGVAAVEKVPLDVEQALNPQRSCGLYNCYNVSFASLGRRVYGELFIPKDTSKGPFPLRIQVPGAGLGIWSMQGSPRKEGDEVFLFMSVFPWSLKESGQGRLYEAMKADFKTRFGYTGYYGAGLNLSAEASFYYPVILGINRAVTWAAALPEVDRTRIGYYGISQGGAFGCYLTYLNPNIKKCVSTVTAFSDLVCDTAGRNPSVENEWFAFDDPAEAAKARANSPYLDSVNFAGKIKTPIRFVCGQCDWICPPHTVYAAFNACPSADKKIEITRGNHGDPGQFGAYLKWLAEPAASSN